jgi:hypothetical protein
MIGRDVGEDSTRDLLRNECRGIPAELDLRERRRDASKVHVRTFF